MLVLCPLHVSAKIMALLNNRKSMFSSIQNLNKSIIPGGPEITEQSIQSIFQDFALINSYFLHLVG